jgi:type I restriction enzyme M protein
MARTRKANADQPKTTAQSLGSLLKSARDIMRKDKGLSTDIDRLPMLTWIMFLKFLDDLELQREQEAELARKRFRPAIEAPYRWRDWAANPQGMTGDELIAFVNQDEAVGPDGKRGTGLFAYLRALSSSNGDDRRDVIAMVFRGVQNRMVSGYLLRDVVNKVAGIHFTSSEELHTLGSLYESMLREMRDAAGENGEFYTPRPVVRFIVQVTDPQLGEKVLDPACGTGGFLSEAFEHLRKQCNTVQDHRALQQRSLFGCEAKPLPFLLVQMNLLFHGLDAPQIDPGNALRFKLTEIGEKDRVDVILTNPPFGGEEEKGIQGNFPEDRQTSETALLFLQLIMRKLRRQTTSAGRAARAAVVVPNGTLFGDGVCARIKEELLKEFNLHTIVRLPNGVFAPYTSIPTNLLFFDRSGPTKQVWYYEHPLPEGRKNYTKTQPLQFEEFKPCILWWSKRKENDRAWKVPAKELLANNWNLDRKNPRGKPDFEHLPPEQLADDILKKEQRIAELMIEIKALLAEKP